MRARDAPGRCPQFRRSSGATGSNPESLESAVELTKVGAFSYLPKPYELEKLIEVLKDAYEARLRKKFEADQKKMDRIMDAAEGESPLGILRKLRELDDSRK